MPSIRITKSKNLKPKYEDATKLKFGRQFTDHMLLMNYNPEQGWHDLRIEPFQELSLNPACAVLHYGQAIFEGMKAYKSPDGEVYLFRPEENFTRMNKSAKRMSIPEIDVESVMEGLHELLWLEQDWIPDAPGTSLYIRPTIIAADTYLGLKVSATYLFFIIMCPVGPYYVNGFNPIDINVEEQYVRAAKGGTGNVKAAGNYAASLLAEANAKKKGYTQVLWLDAVEHKYCEEVGAMNIFFVLGDTIVTPALSGSILPGITRKSIIQLAKDLGYKVEERPISITEIYSAHDKGVLKEIFGTGTAAVVSPVGTLSWHEKAITVNGGNTGPITQRLYDELTGIQNGQKEDKYGWRAIVK